MIDLVKALRNRATWETATGITEPHEHIDWMAADEITSLREENAQLRDIVCKYLEGSMREKDIRAAAAAILEGEKNE